MTEEEHKHKRAGLVDLALAEKTIVNRYGRSVNLLLGPRNRRSLYNFDRHPRITTKWSSLTTLHVVRGEFQEE